MRTAFLFILLLATSTVGTFAADAPKGPNLSDLMKQPSNRAAWHGMLAGETPPPWVEHYAKTLDGPPTPAITVKADGHDYTLAFTCKPGACAENQLFVLFSSGGAKAWGLLVTGDQTKWWGAPDESIRRAILGSIQ
jgi:hypothetical protein